MATAVVSGGDCDGDIVVSCCHFRLRKDCGRDRAKRVRIESTESTPGDSRAHGHAAGARNFPDRLIDLAENSEGGTVEIARSSLHPGIAHRCDVDQGTNCLRVFAARDRRV